MTLAHHFLLKTKQIKWLEQMACAKQALTESVLMERAGMALFQVFQRVFPYARQVVVLCGAGNNAGDAYVLSRLLYQSGYEVTLLETACAQKLPDPALKARALVSKLPVIQSLDDVSCDVVVDGLLGTGLVSLVRPKLHDLIEQVNAMNKTVLSIDVPSGLNADTGQVMGIAIQANVTVTFIAKKIGLMTGMGPNYTGQLFTDDLGLSHLCDMIRPQVTIIDESFLEKTLPKRRPVCHKRNFGHVLVIGGAQGMPGATLLAAEAALRVGAGMVTVATTSQHANSVLAALPEVMWCAVDDPSDLEHALALATTLLCGPGLGTDAWALSIFEAVMKSALPMVVDASALRLLAIKKKKRDHWILTPHPGEAAALLDMDVVEIEADRSQAVSRLYDAFGGNIVLKGKGSLIQTKEGQFLSALGNSGMATAGMGDVLSGVIAGLVAQGVTLSNALCAGVFLHAKAGDLAAKDAAKGMLAHELMPYLRQLVNHS